MTRVSSAAAAVALLALLVGCEPYQPHGTLVDPPLAVPAFTLQTHHGEVSRADFEGRLVALFFGFTECPDVCPDTMARLRQAVRLLDPREAEQVQVVLISVDPERDDPERVGAYAAQFDSTFVGLTGSRHEIARVAAAYGIYHEKMPMGEAGDYTVDHTAAVTVLNRRGETVMIWRYGIAPEEMAADLRYLLRRS